MSPKHSSMSSLDQGLILEPPLAMDNSSRPHSPKAFNKRYSLPSSLHSAVSDEGSTDEVIVQLPMWPAKEPKPPRSLQVGTGLQKGRAVHSILKPVEPIEMRDIETWLVKYNETNDVFKPWGKAVVPPAYRPDSVVS